MDFAEILKEQSEAIARAFVAGHSEGYRLGYEEGFGAARKLLQEVGLIADEVTSRESSAERAA